MAQPSEPNGLCSYSGSRVVSLLVAIFLVVYFQGHIFSSKGNSKDPSLCRSCDCDCFAEFALPSDFNSSLYADCGKYDPYVSEELEKTPVALMSEEIDLHRRVANETWERTRALAMDFRQTSSHYQKEAEKCTAQMDTCEEARQKAEAGLVEEQKLSLMWEKRARELGFTGC